ncbi:MAG: hypothetical protein PHP99_05050 [Paludibacter sp.]|jgi:hypothetical protein|nr:hypothetical protein [Paludibacter sp.]
MKKALFLLAISFFIFSCNDVNDPQEENPVVKENLLKDWGGNGITGNGSEPTAFGWISSNSSAVWGPANSNVVGSTRYVDVSGSSNPQHTHNDTTYVGRLLMYRWDGSYWGSRLTKIVTLKANTNYTFKWKYEWWSNGTLPTYNLAIGSNSDGSTNIGNKDFPANSAKNLLTDGELKFKTNNAGEYYLIFTQNGLTSSEGTLIGMADLSLTED